MNVLGSILLVAAMLSGGQDQKVKPPEQGDCAPDFVLPNHEGKDVKLSAYRGKRPVVLVFYRGSF